MEEIYGTIGIGAIILIILAVLPYIAIIGTWFEIKNMREETDINLEYISKLLLLLTDKDEEENKAGFQPALTVSETEQNHPNG